MTPREPAHLRQEARKEDEGRQVPANVTDEQGWEISAAEVRRCWGEITELRDLLREWVQGRADTSGKFTHHYPIDATIHGNRVAPEQAWGCNAGCGQGWPCLTMRTLDALKEETIEPVHGIVDDYGGGQFRVWIDRDTPSYPDRGARGVWLSEAHWLEFREWEKRCRENSDIIQRLTDLLGTLANRRDSLPDWARELVAPWVTVR